MGLLSILKKVKEKEKEIRVLMLWVDHVQRHYAVRLDLG